MNSLLIVVDRCCVESSKSLMSSTNLCELLHGEFQEPNELNQFMRSILELNGEMNFKINYLNLTLGLKLK